MIRVFIGYDDVEAVAYHTYCHSILKRASEPVALSPLHTEALRKAGLYRRDRDAKQSNEFSFTRFLVPALCDFSGWALFTDCDMLMLGDIAGLWALRDDRYSVMVVKHDYEPSTETKFMGARQYRYPKKNWSSVMLFNCPRCRALTPDYVNTAPPLNLHQFKWCGEDEVGELPATWNHLVGEYPHDPGANLVHFTIGGPYFKEYHGCDYSSEWTREWEDHNYCEQRKC